MDEKNYAIYNSLGISYDDLKDYVNAEKYYIKSMECNPKYESAAYNLAIMYKAMDNIPKAIEFYEKAIEINPRYSYAYNNLGNIYKNTKREFSKAI